MERASGADGGARAIDEVDALRARHYDLLATLVGRAPCGRVLADLSALRGGEGVLGAALGRLGEAARTVDPDRIGRDYSDLFVGVGRGKVMPYASYYLTGFLNERPLARVRGDFAELGIARDPGMREPEDNLAILLEVMAALAAGRVEASEADQARFFARHVAPWAARCCGDVEAEAETDFYRAVGALGRTFVEVEAEAFAMDA